MSNKETRLAVAFLSRSYSRPNPSDRGIFYSQHHNSLFWTSNFLTNFSPLWDLEIPFYYHQGMMKKIT